MAENSCGKKWKICVGRAPRPSGRAQLDGRIVIGHSNGTDSLLSRLVSRGDQASVEGAQPAIAAKPESKVGLLLSTFQELIRSGEMGVNTPGAQVYVEGDKTAVVVPIAISMARDRLKTRQIVLPTNTHLYNMLRNARLVDADETGHSVRRSKVQGKHGPVSLSALILPQRRSYQNTSYPISLPPTSKSTLSLSPRPKPPRRSKVHGRIDMNTLIANQYGRVQGEMVGSSLALAVAAQTPRRESVLLETRIDSVEQQLYLLAILRAVDRRIEQFQLRDSDAAQSSEHGTEAQAGVGCGWLMFPKFGTIWYGVGSKPFLSR